MSNYTRGEWKWEQRGDYHYLNGANGFRVLSIKDGVVPMNSDARLIASAPELLSELERVVSWFQQFQHAQRNGGSMVELLQNVDLSGAIGVISKAKGIQ